MLYVRLGFLVKWQGTETLRLSMPEVLKRGFAEEVVMVDYFELKAAQGLVVLLIRFKRPAFASAHARNLIRSFKLFSYESF